MLVLFLQLTVVLLTVNFVGNIEVRRSDINPRVRFLGPEGRYLNRNPNRQRSLPEAFNIRTYDYDDHSSRYMEPPPPPNLHNLKAGQTKHTLKVHSPREDPRLYYQTDTYRKDYRGKTNKEVTILVSRPDEVVGHGQRPLPLRKRHHEEDNAVVTEIQMIDLCIRCPNDRTLIARTGFDRVLLAAPRIFTCSGQKAPKDVHFIQMYGPKFGSLVAQGSHTIIGRITFKEKSYHLCKMQVHVITQSCATPSYLISHCEIRSKPCNFTCRNPLEELYGLDSLMCGSDMKWIGPLPLCKAKTWCSPPSPPEHGRVNCVGAIVGKGLGFMAGAKCRVRCVQGYRWSRAAAICRGGSWSHTLMCVPKRTII